MEAFGLMTLNRPIEVFHHWQQNGALNLNPPYQRGVVWGQKRQVNLIYSLLAGIPIPAIILNDRMKARWGKGAEDWQYTVIDGKQRITAVLRFLDGHLEVPGEWFDLPDFTVNWWGLPLRDQRRFHNKCIPTCEGALKTLADERKVFDLINFGGLAQGEKDE